MDIMLNGNLSVRNVTCKADIWHFGRAKVKLVACPKWVKFIYGEYECDQYISCQKSNQIFFYISCAKTTTFDHDIHGQVTKMGKIFRDCGEIQQF